jgi:hypothetical protein
MEQENSQQNNIVTTDPTNLETNQSNPSLSPEIKNDLTRYEDMRKDFQDLKKDFITVFGIFASFVTFLSIEIQIFKTVTDFWLLLGLSSFLLASIMIFSFSINNLVKGKMEWKELNNPLSFFVGIFIVIAVVCFGLYAHNSRTQNFENRIYIQHQGAY